MKKLKLIYNPYAGDRSFRFDLDPCIAALQEGGYSVHVVRGARAGSVEEEIARMTATSYDALAVCGGDGSVNAAVNAMMNNGVRVPLGVIPCGTANDFAAGLGLPAKHEEAAAVIAAGKLSAVDLGLANGRYFANVCAGGMFTNISKSIDAGFKNTFGKLAYYVKGVEQMPGFEPMRLKITGSRRVYVEDIFLFCLLNTTGTGGFDKLSPGASVNDGLFDFIAIRAFPIHEFPVLFLKMLAGEYLDDNRVIFFRDDVIRVEAPYAEPDAAYLETDVDGEAGPRMPVEVRNLREAIQIFVP